MPKLTIITGTDKGRVFELTDSVTTIGRSVISGFQIVDRRMSRSHAQICFRNDGYYIEDLKSKNGTQLNGREIRVPTLLQSGDKIHVGDTVIDFEVDSHSPILGETPIPSKGSDKKRESSTGYRLVEERQWGATRNELRAGVASSGTVKLGTDLGRQLKDTSKRLEIIYQVTEAIRSTFKLDDLLTQIMEIITGVFSPDNSYLLLLDPETGQLEPKVIRSGREDAAETEVKISTSIVERCISEGISMLVSDAAQDDRFATSESIIMNRIRTAMVAPLLHKEETLGVVYVDTRTRIMPYTPEELELLTGVTNQAAMAIVNARLAEQIIEQHKLAREMEIARTIQMNLLPKIYPDLDGYEISAMSLPAKQVGGDYYDFIRLPDGRMVLAIADVSGKGVPAAILTATTRSYLQSETQHPTRSLAEVIESINRMVHRDVTNDMYVTMAVLYLHESAGEIEYVNAGHSHPILIDRAGNIEHLDRGGVFLGIMPEAGYETGHLKLGYGDILVMDTDGVTDILNQQGEPFGAERLVRLLQDNRHLRAEEIRNVVYQACLKHRGEADQFDDFTLIVLKRREYAEGVFDELELD